jgi:hypothetical protein
MIFAALRRLICALILVVPVIAIAESNFSGHGAARAEAPSTAEKDAFEAAKELGTVEAWDAFLSNYSSGFHADLARAYVKKLAEGAPPAASPAPSQPAATAFPRPQPAGSWGGIVRDGPGQNYGKVESLDEGERIMLLERTEVVTDGFPWFKISFRGGATGYKWGGILCSVDGKRDDLFETCPATQRVRETEREPREVTRTKPSKPKGCGKSSIMIDGRCIKKRDAATHCGPGYRLKGNTCVQGYQEPKPQQQRPSWQIEAIKKGCKPGMGWNAQEGCHEND